MKSRILSERSIVVVLFVMVLVTFSLAQEDTKKIERTYQEITAPVTSSNQPVPLTKQVVTPKSVITPAELR
ncbi:MAG: hypothetical protein H7Y42_12820 [Chitinophagaceae bacterium]|nr:hypothetical protein [Chitinophagaceae bacterium]